MGDRERIGRLRDLLWTILEGTGDRRDDSRVYDHEDQFIELGELRILHDRITHDQPARAA